jgi:hypothetical protein
VQRSTYDYFFEDGVHVLIDKNKGASITNDAENVIKDLRRKNLDLRLPVIYRDSMGGYDRLLVTHDEFAGFLPLRTRDRGTAIKLARGIAALKGE